MSIFITGIGAISAIGSSVDENLQSLISQQTGIKKGTQAFNSNYLVGEVPFSNNELMERFKLSTKGSRTALLGMVAAKEAFSSHALFPNIRTGLISGTSVGGMDLSEIEYKHFLAGTAQDLSVYKHHPSGTTTQEIANELEIKDFVNTISTACSSAANAIMMGARMIQQGKLDRVIVGGTDSLTLFTIAGFRSLMIFDEAWCRPFDETRKGLNLGEGAGFLILESEKSLGITKKTPLALLAGWNNSSDAYHQTASSPEGFGATLAMKSALEMANLTPNQIDYINAHGTATPNNDESESHAIKTVFGQTIPPFSSTKAYTGHTLAASGGIEAVFSVLAIQNNLIFPNLNWSTPIVSTQLIPQLELDKTKEINNIVSNSFGFGGNNSSLVITSL